MDIARDEPARAPLRPATLSLLLLAGCFFSPSGSAPEDDGTDDASTAAPTSADASDTAVPTSGGDELCGNFQVDEGEACDNGKNGGALCREDCQLNTCGDGYLADAVEGCDDGNTVDGDGCSAACALEGCGDGLTAGMEECDDGNSVDDDACTNLCRLPVCGDGVTNGDEQCDDPAGNSETGACLPGCTQAVCGDGFVHDGVEACDDMNAVDDDGCSNSCTTAGCGDGQVQRGEQCDDGNDVDEDACLGTCQFASCGDGVVHTDVETCDDGNTAPGDGCSASCQDELCGNGVADPGEACDDGNQLDTDACLSTCTDAACGDGVVHAGEEECDDGNADDTDACTSLCTVTGCGDGVVQAGEACDDGMVSATCDAQCERSAYWVFVSSLKVTGKQIMSPAAADLACTQLAMGTPVEGTYKAFLSEDAESASERLFHSPVKYILPNKTTVANSWNDLTDGQLLHPISRDENNNNAAPMIPPSGCNAVNYAESAVWTGSSPKGLDLQDCSGWDSLVSDGAGGLLHRTDSLWSGCTFDCSTQARLYCFEQPAG